MSNQKLDYSLKTTEERIECAKRVLESPVSPQYLQNIADYILFVSEKNQTKLEKESEYPILTKNREVTVNKRQVSYEEVISNLENGEDGLYALINNDKNQLLDHKNPISDKDIENAPGLKEQMQLIETLKKQFAAATGAKRFHLKKQIIEAWQQAYIIKASARGEVAKGRTPQQIKSMARTSIPENITIQNGLPHSDAAISLLNQQHISFLLCYYPQLKEECYDDLQSDLHWLLIDLENLIDKVFAADAPTYSLITWKIDGLTNEAIQEKMRSTYGILHSEQYYSTLWRTRIPKKIMEQAQKDYLEWYYLNVEYGDWKYCKTCGTYKLAHPLFFSKNTSSKDGLYSVCKDCRAVKRRQS